MKRLLALTAGLASTIVLSNVPRFSAAADESPEPVPFEQLEWAGEHLAMTIDVASRDSDGDGWTDWYERLEGTDPFDPSSHPTSLTVEIVDGTAFVQSFTFPDRLAVVDLQLSEHVGSIGSLLGAFDGLGVTGLGALEAQLSELSDVLGADMVSAILDDVFAEMGLSDPPVVETRVNGIDASLVSAVHVDHNSKGDLRVTITTETSSVAVIHKDDGSQVVLDTDRSGLDDSGSGDVVTFKVVGGEVVTIMVTTYDNGVPVRATDYDTKTKQFTTINAGTTPSSGTPTDGTKPTETTAKATDTTAKATDTTAEATDTTAEATDTTKPTQSTEEPTQTTSGYVDPDADPILIPSAEQLAERADFLRNVNARFGPRAPVGEPLLPSERPSVGDPEDPPCEDERCAWFSVLDAPQMDLTRGGCPPASCNSAGPQRP